MNNVDPKDCSDERFYVWWYCPQTKLRDMAGVAYYNEKNGDYRLILNFFPDNNYFLKCLGGGTNEPCHYRLLSVKERKGKKGRFFQGEGVLDNVANEIIIQTAPFSKWLVVSLSESSSHHRPSNSKKEVI